MIRRMLVVVVGVLVALVAWGCRAGGEEDWVAYVPAGEGYRRVALDREPPVPDPTSSVQVDLDADGVPEVVRIVDEQVYIERDGRVVWQGETAWQVVELVAGDVEDDLRREVLLALWKEDAGGVPRSHPFIVGHRHGRYDVLWGGSAVAAPIRDLDLGDVDGDGRTELVVLEGRYEEPAGSPGRFVTVWRWNGWGFTLLWRSEPGAFHRLALLDVDGDGGREIVVGEVKAPGAR